MLTNIKASPDNISQLGPNEIFVFGSNEGGFHGAGAARQAMKWGAKYGQGDGLMGQTYGIATKDRKLNVLTLRAIQINIERFLRYAEKHPEFVFLVTAIGTGLAGYKTKDIAPLFGNKIPNNVRLPQSFIDYLSK